MATKALWDAARAGFNLLEDQHPAAVAYPADASDVPAAVSYARRAGLRVAPQATGHDPGAARRPGRCAAAQRQPAPGGPDRSGCSPGTGGRRGQVGAGRAASLRPRAGGPPRLLARVGIAGYSLGGGIGWLSRAHGLQANAVTALELVTGDGELLRADHAQHPDLFWALRGGGGNFGVVTAIEFGVVPLDELYAGAIFLPFERASDVLHAWSALLPSLPDAMTSWRR